jgi:hypothetical protein
VCPDGALRIAGAIAKVTASDGLTPQPVSGWEHDPAWRSSPRYDDPKNGCDPTLSSNTASKAQT